MRRWSCSSGWARSRGPAAPRLSCATGETARKRDPFTAAGLTPQERQIAGLVADGMTNREIAAQLFLSPRIIDYHLRRVLTTLGIASRTELVREVLARRPSC